MNEALDKQPVFIFNETQEGDDFRFACEQEGVMLAAATATLTGPDLYDIGGIFVDSSRRNQGVGSKLMKQVNNFLIRVKAKGRLINMAQGDAARLYESSGWKKGAYISHGAHGGYEYTFDGLQSSQS